MSHVFPRNITAPPVKAVASEGCYIIDETGKRYLDGSGGAAVSCLGHGDPEVIAAIKDASKCSLRMDTNPIATKTPAIAPNAQNEIFAEKYS